MMLTIELLKNMPFASIDRHFAAYIQEQSRQDDPLIYAVAAIASAAVRLGHTCCDLNKFSGKTFSDFFQQLTQNEDDADIDKNILFPSVEEFRKILTPPWGIALTEEKDEHAAQNIPLVLDSCGRLYLNRYFMYEKELAERILQFVSSPETAFDPGKEKFNSVIPFFQLPEEKPVEHVDWQKFAAYLTGISPLTIITGGPGTGKTTVVAAVLALILEKYESNGKFPRIMLCAPTGKAQSRLAESIRDSLKDLNCTPAVRAELERLIDPENPEKCCGTIHALLGVKWNTPNFRKNQENPIDADILLADEISMISLPLMCKLLRALKPGTKLILLGDKDQLASVDAGAVLGDFCKNVPFNLLSADRKKDFIALTESPEQELRIIPESFESPLTGHIAELKISRRFDENSQIGKISSMIRNRQNAAQIKAEIMIPTADFFRRELPEKPEGLLKEFFADIPQKIKALIQEPTVESMKQAYFLLDNYKILCAHRTGNTGVENMNKLCRKLFRMNRDDATGLPVMILQNDKVTGLSNGDIGILWNIDSVPRVYFPTSIKDPEPKSFLPFELPPCEPVFAMTVHKSQGSGFDNVLIAFPQKKSPILTRELLYTAITRAKKRVELWCPESLIEPVLNTEVVRHSGLADRLCKKQV
ncbi:MAG: exodeoxyribonuclease V subunit alpha [Lentisphaeria bacterium]|nr:exodeoxyribonuclease V subunit alpha [Lentisphaeria bacterium]